MALVTPKGSLLSSSLSVGVVSEDVATLHMASRNLSLREVFYFSVRKPQLLSLLQKGQLPRLSLGDIFLGEHPFDVCLGPQQPSPQPNNRQDNHRHDKDDNNHMMIVHGLSTNTINLDQKTKGCQVETNFSSSTTHQESCHRFVEFKSPKSPKSTSSRINLMETNFTDMFFKLPSSSLSSLSSSSFSSPSSSSNQIGEGCNCEYFLWIKSHYRIPKTWEFTAPFTSIHIRLGHEQGPTFLRFNVGLLELRPNNEGHIHQQIRLPWNVTKLYDRVNDTKANWDSIELVVIFHLQHIYSYPPLPDDSVPSCYTSPVVRMICKQHSKHDDLSLTTTDTTTDTTTSLQTPMAVFIGTELLTARSEVFRRALASNLTESRNFTFEITDIPPHN